MQDSDAEADSASGCSQDPEAHVRRYTEVRTKTQQLYDTGKPLFKREVLKQLRDQLRDGKSSSLNHKYIKYKVATYDDQEVELEYAAPQISEYFHMAPEEESSSEDEDEFAADDDKEDDFSDSMSEPEDAVTMDELLRKSAEEECVSVNSAEECIDGPAVIEYSSVQDLFSIDRFVWSSETFLCPLRLCNVLYTRRADTGEIKRRLRRPYEDIIDTFEADMRSWAFGQEYQRLKNTLISASIPKNITKIIGFAFGSMSYSYKSVLPNRGTNSQHALLLTVCKLLREIRDDASVACYAQDPAYTNDDKRLLASKQVRVLDDPDGFLEVDENSVIISCASNVPVKQIVSDLASPAIMIWDYDHGETDEKLMKARLTDPYSPRLRELIRQKYITYDFPGKRVLFGKLSIFIRKQEGR